jgi:hypothetical protein
VVQAVDRALGASHALGDLRRRQADEVTHDDDLALVVGELAERLAQRPAVLRGVRVGVDVRRPRVRRRRGPARAQVVDGHVARDAQDPRRERDVARLVARQDREQLGEDVLREVLGLVLVAHDARHVAVHVVGVAHVQEAQRLGVALLGSVDGRVDERAVAAVVECAPAPEAPRGHTTADAVRGAEVDDAHISPKIASMRSAPHPRGGRARFPYPPNVPVRRRVRKVRSLPLQDHARRAAVGSP